METSTRTSERVWFTSDTHFGHRNIFKFCPNTRQGKNIEEHDEILIQNWNKDVLPQDRVYHLGDFCFGNSEYAEKVLKRLSGRIYFIPGNHDHVIENNKRLQNYFEWMGYYKEIDLPIPNAVFAPESKPPTHKVCLFHFPIFEWNRMHHGSFHLYGHVHGNLQTQVPHDQWYSHHVPGRAMDVGVDTRPVGKLMTPWSWEEVYDILIKREIRGHHDVIKGM